MSSSLTTGDEKQASLYDLSFLETLSGNDAGFLPMMTKLFIDTTPGIVQKMEEALNNEDWTTVGLLAHKLKPTIDTMSISSLTQTVRLIELHGKTETAVELLPEKVMFIATTLKKCVASLRAEF